MRPPLHSEIALNPDDFISAYQRARKLLRLGVSGAQDGALRLIVNVAKKPQRDRSAISDDAVTQVVLYRKKYFD